MDVGDWLRSLGLGQYEATFRDNAIGMDILADLTENDLGQFGVCLVTASDCSRRSRACSVELAPKPSIVTVLTAPKPDAAERRQLTVMFCDLVGSTAMSARLDPEDMRAIIGAYHRCCASLIERNGGFVAKYMGDGVLAYFGYPQAHEHDAERAVRAGLAIVEAAPKLVTAAGVAAARAGRDRDRAGRRRRSHRIGRGAGARRRRRDAEPRGAAASDRRTRHGRHRRGHAQAARQSVRASGPRRQGPQGHRRAGAGLGGAAGEFRGKPLRGAARERPDRAGRAGRGIRIAAAALVQGEERRRPGGAALRRGRHRQIAAHGGAARTPRRRTAHAGYAISARRSTPTARSIRSSARWNAPPDWRTTMRRRRSSTSSMRCSRRPRPRSRTPRCSPRCCRCRTMAAIPRSIWTAPQRRQRTLEALVSQMEALTRQNPVLMIFEDAHWTDPTSLEAFGRMVDRIAGLRALLIVTFRPEFEAPWIGRPHVTALTINRLAQREIDAMIDRVAGNKLLPASIRQDIVERTDGIPLFVEEMTKAVLEAEGEGEARRTVSGGSVPGAGGPRKLARLADGAARPARPGQGGGADRRGDRAGVFACPAGCGGAQAGGGAGDRRSTVSLPPVCCSGRARRRMRPICSSTPWCRTRPMARCCASRDARFTPASPKPSKANSRRSPRTSRNCWRAIAPRPG